jgi:hypothetical protein
MSETNCRGEREDLRKEETTYFVKDSFVLYLHYLFCGWKDYIKKQAYNMGGPYSTRRKNQN